MNMAFPRIMGNIKKTYITPVFLLYSHITIRLSILLTSAMGGFLHTKQFCDTSWVSYNLTQF